MLKGILSFILLFFPFLLKAQSWTVLGDLHIALTGGSITALCIGTNDSVYTAAQFTDLQVSDVVKWTGNSWQYEYNANGYENQDYIYTMCSDPSGNIYAAGDLRDANWNRSVAKWNGNSWSILGSGANSLSANNTIRFIYSDAAKNIYATGDFTNSNGLHYIAKWNGTSWAELGTLNANGAIHAISSDKAGNVYAAGLFTNASSEYYVAKWDGTSWAELGTGTDALHANGGINTIGTDSKGNIYAAGAFSNNDSKYYVAQWNGTSWSEVGRGIDTLKANLGIYTICLDSKDNLYAAGRFTDTLGKYYVAKWNDSSWSELGNGFDIPLTTLCSDAADNIYTYNMADTSAPYVAKYGNNLLPYKVFPDHDGEWKMSVVEYGVTGPFADPYCYNYSYTLSTDTIIQSKTYHKLFDGNTYPGFFRNEGSKVYYLNASTYSPGEMTSSYQFNDQPESILYDYSLQVGDSYVYYIDDQNVSYSETVTSIDTFGTVNGKVMRSWHFSNTNNTFYQLQDWIEGIGSFAGFFCTKPVGAEFDFNLYNYRENGIDYLHGTSSCITLSSKSPVDNSELKIYPNPSEGLFTAGYSNGKTIDRVSVYNTLGELVQQTPAAVATIVLDLSPFTTGLYILQVESGGMLYNYRLMKK